MKLDSRVALNPLDTSELFAEYFSSVFNDLVLHVPSFDFNWNFTVPNCVISPTDVQSRFEALDCNKGAGPDDIPPLVLKFCAPVLASHFAIMFSALLSIGIFPSILKQGFVVPVLKSGDPGNVKNYRPIVIQPAIAKVFESIIMDHLYFHLRKCISPAQHGFLRCRSTVTNLLEFQECVMSAFTDSFQLDCIYLDFSKAFDKVNHSLLVAKLEGYGVVGSLLRWLDSYLRRRTLIVKCNGSLSRPFDVLSGVPQGSHLGPLLFILFMNDIGSRITSQYLIFADDMKIFGRVKSVEDFANLQGSLVGISGWCRENAMELNVLKCEVLSFKRGHNIHFHDYHLNDSILRRVFRVKDLGVVVTPSLSPLEHIIQVTARANSLLGFIFRASRDFTSPFTLVCLYKSLVRPILEYGSVIWSPYQLTHIEQLQNIQDRFIRLLGPRFGYTYRTTPVSEMGTHLGLPSLRARRQLTDLVTLFKLVNGLLDCPYLLSDVDFCASRGTRSKSIFRRRFQATFYAYHNGLTRLLRLGSEAASEVDFFSESVASFKKKIPVT